MATLREYFEKDFGNYTRIHILLPYKDLKIEGAILYDFTSYIAFLVLYIVETSHNFDFYKSLISSLSWGKTQLSFDGRVTLPSVKSFPGQMRIQSKPTLEIFAKFHGENEWISTTNIVGSKRVFIYTDDDFSKEEMLTLKKHAKEIGHELQIRNRKYIKERSKFEHPLAFISHDSRDKDVVASRIAINLQSRLCPVWYDEYSLKIGDNLRESIEKGLKECKKCILVLSQNYLSNNGWTKKEFDSIFTRELIEDQKLILPVWYKISKKQVYEYSPSLANVVAADWEKLGEDKVCKMLYHEIID